MQIAWTFVICSAIARRPGIGRKVSIKSISSPATIIRVPESASWLHISTSELSKNCASSIAITSASPASSNIAEGLSQEWKLSTAHRVTQRGFGVTVIYGRLENHNLQSGNWALLSLLISSSVFLKTWNLLLFQQIPLPSLPVNSRDTHPLLKSVHTPLNVVLHIPTCGILVTFANKENGLFY